MSARFTLDKAALTAALQGDVIEPHIPALIEAVDTRFVKLKHGRFPQWQQALDELPALQIERCQLDQPCVSVDALITKQQSAALHRSLIGLLPWRKGPFRLADQHIDCEWRSDWKWQRLAPHISDLNGRCVLDVGCGSGYHLWRMRGAGARLALGIDPGLLFLMQFQALQRYIVDPAVQYLPVTLEAMPEAMLCFDTVFSMGVLYHRRDPFEHLNQLKATLRTGGELVLETLIAPGSGDHELPIPERYARMRNIWTLPSAPRLVHWLKSSGFNNIRVVSDAATTLEEQRSTDWMPFQSLADSLDPTDSTLTIEGHPAPRRAIVVATLP